MKNKIHKMYLVPDNNRGLYIKIYTNNPVKQISGHRFVELLGQKPRYANDLSIMLSFLGLLPFKDNIYAQIGREFENIILDYVWGKGTYKQFSYEEYKGDMFPNLNGFCGLIDGLHLTKPKIAEVKTYFSRKKLPQKYYSLSEQRSYRSLSRDYYLQARYYLWAINKNNPNLNIEEVEVLTLFIANANEPEFLEKYFNKFIIYNNVNDGFDKLISKAAYKKIKLMKPKKDEKGRYFECYVKYNTLTKKILDLVKEVNNKTIEGEKIELIWS